MSKARRRLLSLLLSLIVALAGVILAPGAHAAPPAEPTPLFATPGDGNASLSFIPGDDSTVFEGSATTSETTFDWQPLPYDLDQGFPTGHYAGLTNGVTYFLRVRAVNGSGEVSTSSFPTAVTPDGPPLAPMIGTATAGNGTASITFTPPADNGTSAVTGYTAVAEPGGLSSEGCTESPCTVAGLTNGTTYTFTVVASNGGGQSPPSEPSNAVLPRGAPFAPRSIARVGATPVTVTVSFIPPLFSGAGVLGYQISSTNGATWRSVATRVSGTRRFATATGLRPGVRYAIRVRAVNTFGAGASSAAVVILTAPATIGARPAARGGTSAALVTWRASTQRDVLGYLVVSTRGARCYTQTRTETACIIGNTAGVDTYYRVYARSVAGYSYASAASNTVRASSPPVPSSLPGVPGGFRAVSKKVKTGKSATLIARGFLPNSSVVLVAYGAKRHVVKRFTSNAAGNFKAVVTMPKDSVRSLTFVAFGVTPYASSKAIAASIRRG